jgi:hypothetical protein
MDALVFAVVAFGAEVVTGFLSEQPINTNSVGISTQVRRIQGRGIRGRGIAVLLTGCGKMESASAAEAAHGNSPDRSAEALRHPKPTQS